MTGATKGEVKDRLNQQTVNVFIPTTPNPTSGFLLFCPNEDLVYLEMSVEDAVKLVVSGGIVTPPQPTPETSKKKISKKTRSVAKTKTKPKSGAAKKAKAVKS